MNPYALVGIVIGVVFTGIFMITSVLNWNDQGGKLSRLQGKVNELVSEKTALRQRVVKLEARVKCLDELVGKEVDEETSDAIVRLKRVMNDLVDPPF